MECKQSVELAVSTLTVSCVNEVTDWVKMAVVTAVFLQLSNVAFSKHDYELTEKLRQVYFYSVSAEKASAVSLHRVPVNKSSNC